MKRTSLFPRAIMIAALLATCFISMGQAEEQPAATTGDQWEVTSRMTMEGMPDVIPPQKKTVCAPKVWKEPPGAMDERQKCTNSDFKMTGQKATWKTRCEGPPAMTGEGEITREAESYSGTIKFTSPDGIMTIRINGRRTGDCDVKP